MSDVSKIKRGMASLPKSIGVTMRPPVTGAKTDPLQYLHSRTYHYISISSLNTIILLIQPAIR